MKFIIIFMGLISHVGLHTPNMQQAVFVNAPHPVHHAVLRVKTADIQPGTTPTLKAVTAGCPAGETCFDLTGEHVTLVGAPGAATIRDASFLTHVPRLSKITDAPNSNGTQRVKNAIANGQKHGDVSAYLKYSGGTLKVDRVWCSEVEFVPPLYTNGPMCVAHDVVYESEAFNTEFVELRGRRGHTVKLRANATVIAENLPKANATNPHFHHMRSIMDNVDLMGKMTPTGRLCDQDADRPGDAACIPGQPGPALVDFPRPSGNRAVDFECSNSSFP